MKCPSCGYIAFQATEECVSCGSPTPPTDSDAPLDEAEFRRHTRRGRDQLGFGFGDSSPDEPSHGDIRRPGEQGDNDFAFGDDDTALLPPMPARGDTADDSSGTGNAFDGGAHTGGGTGESTGDSTGDDSSFGSGTHWLEDQQEPGESTWVEVYRLASGFGRRFAAMLLDTVFFGGLFGLLFVVVQRDAGDIPLTNPAFIPTYLFLLVLHAFYFTFFHASTGQTPGKMLLGIRVVGVRGGQVLSPWDAFVRWLGYFMAGLPLGIGFLWSFLDPDDRGWHDKWARSVVVLVDSLRGDETTTRADPTPAGAGSEDTAEPTGA